MKLRRDIIEKICEHALSEYPLECCGIITGAGDSRTVRPCENIQNRMHAEDPHTYPRDARTAYLIERSEFDRAVTSARKNGEEIIAFYHSHCDHESYFSEEDFAAQTVFGEPEFPHAHHLIVSVMNRRLNDIKCYTWDSASKRFSLLEGFLED